MKRIKDKIKLSLKLLILKIYNLLKPVLSFIKNILLNIALFFRLDKAAKKTKLDRLYNKLKLVDPNLYIKIFTLILSPVLIFYYCQMFCNGKIFFEFGRYISNFIFLYFIIILFYSILGKVKYSLITTSVLTFFIGLINHFITAFRGTPLVPWDIFSLNVGLAVLPTFTFKIDKNLIIGIILFIINIIYLICIPIESFENTAKKKIARSIALIATMLCITSFYLTNVSKIFDLNENWDPKEEYHNNGLITSLFKQSRNLVISKPDNYDINSLTELANSIEVTLLDKDEDFESPNIIMIMNESFSDLSVIGNFKTNEDYLPNFRALSKNTIKGNLHVSIFGATTPNSEWEVLTSNSMGFVPKRTVPYQQYVLRKSYSLASILKEQGYSTTAIHCYYPQGYNRNLAYPRLGFDKFYSMYELEDLNYIREYPDDLSTYKNIIRLFENKKDGEKFFNFTLTMQNHGSYTDEEYKNTITAEDNQYPKLNQYLSLIKTADESLKYLLDYFSTVDEHTIIVLFGDHQPYVEDEFYQSLLSQKYEDITSKEAVENKYITPYMIWANYDIDTDKYQVNDISTNYLTSLVLSVANIQKTPYLCFLDKLREKIPLITGNGYMTNDKVFHDFDEENEYKELLENYHFLQFNNMFDNKNKLKALFEVPTK